MSTLKKLVAFIRAKLTSFMSRNLSVEDQYIQAAESVIDEVHKLRTRHVTATTDIRDFEKRRDEKVAAAESVEKDIRYRLSQSAEADVTTQAKLGILHRRMAEAFDTKIVELRNMKIEIEKSVVDLDDVRKDLQSKLEVYRVQREANALGLGTAEDVIDSANLSKIDVETHITRIQTFNSEPTNAVTTSADIAEYLANLQK